MKTKYISVAYEDDRINKLSEWTAEKLKSGYDMRLVLNSEDKTDHALGVLLSEERYRDLIGCESLLRASEEELSFDENCRVTFT